MNSLTRIMSYDKTKNQENCNCVECTNVEVENQIVEYPHLTDEEIEQIIKERYDYKDEKTKTFIKKALRVHGDRYDYSNAVYVKAREKVEISCRVEGHDPFPQTPDKHLQGQGCRTCGGNKKLTKEEFIKKARKIHGNKYDYSKVKYVNARTKVIITCSKHGDFKQTPNKHLCGRGCRECQYDLVSKLHKLNTEEFIKRAKEIHGDKYDYSKVNYVGCEDEVIIICPKHGEFPQIPLVHLCGSGCQKCNSSKGEIAVRSYLIKNEIKFTEQKKFKDCKDKYSLPFDFYLPKYNLCIEYDGLQHFQKVKWNNFMTEEKSEINFKYVQFHDKIKNEYCNLHNMNLLRIRYNENVEEKLDEYFQEHNIIK